MIGSFGVNDNFVETTATVHWNVGPGGVITRSFFPGAFPRISRDNHLIDPAVQIAYKLTLNLAARYGGNVKPQVLRIAPDSVDGIVAAAKASTRFVVDVRTVLWGIEYIPAAPSRYSVHYLVKARLIDTVQRAVLAEGVCRYGRTDPQRAPSYDDLAANHAALVRWELGTATAVCVQMLQKQMQVASN